MLRGSVLTMVIVSTDSRRPTTINNTHVLHGLINSSPISNFMRYQQKS